MSKLSRCYTALGRLRTSKGFGIHSPFAFRFVLRVLREKAQFYAYETITEAYHIEKAKHRKNCTPLSVGKLVFRVTNYFKPDAILAFGNLELTESLALMSYSMKVKLSVVGTIAKYPEIFQSTSFPDRVEESSDRNSALANYFSAHDFPFVYVEQAAEGLSKGLTDRLTQERYVVVVKNMHKVSQNHEFWEELLQYIDNVGAGMSFTNGKIGICYFNDKLPLQHFKLWL